METQKKGFTLIELLIVIGILSVLATIVTLILNPAELLQQARDTQRISDLGSMRSAIAFYISTVSSPDLDGTTTSCTTLCYYYSGDGGGNGAAGCGGRHGSKTATPSTSRTVDEMGWIPIDLTDIPGGSPLAVLPIDPVGDSTYFYSYACDNTAKTFELNAALESERYTTTEGLDATDGGDSATLYEVGTDPGLNL